MENPIFYIVELDMPTVDREAQTRYFHEWFAHVHTPHLYEAGFTTCTSYRAISGEMEFVDIYQARDWSIFESSPFGNYRRIAAADPHLPSFMFKTPNTRTPYHHMAWGPETMAEMAKPLVADWVTVWRFAADDGMFAAARAWLAAGGAAALRAKGAETIRLLRKTTEAPTGRSIRPDGAMVLQWATQPDAAALGLADLPPALGAAIDAATTFTGYRVYPWADDPAVAENFPTFRD